MVELPYFAVLCLIKRYYSKWYTQNTLTLLSFAISEFSSYPTRPPCNRSTSANRSFYSISFKGVLFPASTGHSYLPLNFHRHFRCQQLIVNLQRPARPRRAVWMSHKCSIHRRKTVRALSVVWFQIQHVGMHRSQYHYIIGSLVSMMQRQIFPL